MFALVQPCSPSSRAVACASPTCDWPVPQEKNAKPPARRFVRTLRDSGSACSPVAFGFGTSALILRFGCARFGRGRYGTENDGHRRSDQVPYIHNVHDESEVGGLGIQGLI